MGSKSDADSHTAILKKFGDVLCPDERTLQVDLVGCG